MATHRQGIAMLGSSFDTTGKVEVLSVDDEPSNQAVVQALLSNRDYTITVAKDGKEATEIMSV